MTTKHEKNNYPKIKASFLSNELRVQIPSGICLKKGECGWGLYATQCYKKGETLYINHYEEIDNADRDIILLTNMGDFTLNTITHACVIGPNKRALYNFDAMCNHSCNPNTYSYSSAKMLESCQFAMIALKDIAAGAEITCDYDLFEYDCSDKFISACGCSEKNCRGKVRGFKWLPLAEQLRLLKECALDPYIRKQFLADHPDIMAMT